jgi:hypothetical protein
MIVATLLIALPIIAVSAAAPSMRANVGAITST